MKMMNYESTSNEIKLQFLKYMESLDNAEVSAQEVYESLVDEIILGIIFDVHHAAKAGVLEYDDEVSNEDEAFSIDGLDIGVEVFGHKSAKKEFCTCPICNRSLGVGRFTKHLEKCFQKGRKSSRMASSRIANNTKESIYCGTKSDDDNDSDWTMASDRKRKKKEVNCVKKPRKQKVRSGGEIVDNGVSSANTPPCEYEGMTNDEKRILFTQFCGVISENTGKLCNRSMRCPQHSDEQRRNVRALVLQQPENGLAAGNAEDDGDVHSNASSPTDSSSSSSSKKRQKAANQSKAYKNSPNFTNSNHLLLE